ncbi:hypothetical protein ONZ45_g13926 [Pleurotus djamor]|nr:hypothetical protein ONZ45_g13926 [Pleurotus djamor]
MRQGPKRYPNAALSVSIITQPFHRSVGISSRKAAMRIRMRHGVMPDERVTHTILLSSQKNEVKTAIQRYVRDRPIRLIRLSDMGLLTRDAIEEDIFNRYMAKYSDSWKTGNCDDDISEMGAYAILSHRWTPNELMISDVNPSRAPPT